MSEKHEEDCMCLDCAEERGLREIDKATSTLATPACSAIAYQSRRDVWFALDKLKRASRRIEQELQKEPEGVIPFLLLKDATNAAFEMNYAAGYVNALVLAELPKKSSNDGAETRREEPKI